MNFSTERLLIRRANRLRSIITAGASQAGASPWGPTSCLACANTLGRPLLRSLLNPSVYDRTEAPAQRRGKLPLL